MVVSFSMAIAKSGSQFSSRLHLKSTFPPQFSHLLLPGQFILGHLGLVPHTFHKLQDKSVIIKDEMKP